ncbi:MAG: Alpha,2-mannosidase [Paenibacillus sp.]|nr:Alpha,2-mannosidase [Paenibacillus sp.]
MNKRLFSLLGLLAMLLANLTILPAKADAEVTTTHYYVSPNGSDSNDGTSPSSPWKTLKHAGNVVTAGSTVHVAPGIYTENGIILKNSGTASAPVVYVSDTKWGAKIQSTSSYYVITNNGDYVTFDGFEVMGDYYSCIGIGNTGSETKIINNHIHDVPARKARCGDNGGAGILNADYFKQNNDVVGNVIHHIGSWPTLDARVHCIYQANTGGNIRNNIAYSCSGFGIHMWHADTDVTVTNNTVFNNKYGGVYYGAGDAPGGVITKNMLIANNILVNNGIFGIVETTNLGANNRVYNNVIYGHTNNLALKTAANSGNLIQDPQFYNFTGDHTGDYHLLPNSPAIDKGISLGAPSDDYDKKPRPSGAGFDIGAYESQASETHQLAQLFDASTILIPPPFEPDPTPTTGGTWPTSADWGAAGTRNLGSVNTGIVQTDFDLTVVDATQNGTLGYADTSTNIAGFSNLPMIIAMNITERYFTVRNGAAYGATIRTPYTDGTKFHFRVVANFHTKTYSVYVTPQGGTETAIAENYAFRTNAPFMDDLGQMSLKSDTNGSYIVENHTITSLSWPTSADWGAAGTRNLGSGNTGIVQTDFDLTVVDAAQNGTLGYADTSTNIAGFSNLPMIIAMNITERYFTVRNGAAYGATIRIPYTDGTKFHFRVVAKFPTKTYSVYVTPQGGTETAIAENYAFRTNAPFMDDLGQMSLKSDTNGSYLVENHRITLSDQTAPVTTDNAPTAWSQTDVTVNLTAIDSGSGVAATYYTIDGGEQQTGNTITVSEHGVHTLAYWSVDKAGNIEAQHTATVKIDKSAPVTTDSAPAAWSHADVTVNLTAIDSDSGVAATYYTIDGGEQQTGTTIIVSEEGVHTLAYWSVDKAGNIEVQHMATVKIDKSAPEYSLTVGGNPFVLGTVFTDDKMPTFLLTETDSLSGVASQTMTIDGVNYVNGTAYDLAGKLGTHTIHITITDQAGNVADHTLTFNVETSLASIRNSIERYVAWGDIEGPHTQLLKNILNNADHHLEKEDFEKLATTILPELLDRLSNNPQVLYVSPTAKAVLTTDIQALIESWSN